MTNYHKDFIPQCLMDRLYEFGFHRDYVTYGQVFDWLSKEKGVVITLEPFFTFGLQGNFAYTWKISYINKDEGKMVSVTEEDVLKPGYPFGGSFETTAKDAIEYVIYDLKL